MPRPKQRTEELRGRVVRCALDTLAATGVSGFTTRRVAEGAGTSTPAVYELFGDKAGLVRALFFEGFHLLEQCFAGLEQTRDARRDLRETVVAYRDFARRHRTLAELMFSRPFADFDPGPAELEAGAGVQRIVVHRVRRAVEAGVVDGDATDVAHVLVALAQGLAAAEGTGRLGRSRAAVDRRWDLAVDSLLRGLRPVGTP